MRGRELSLIGRPGELSVPLASLRFIKYVMDQLLELFHFLRDPRALVQAAGYVGLTAIIFTETGLLVGFFLPGDSLLVTAGLLASQPQFGLCGKRSAKYKT
jgi:membrane-associated protein